MDGCSVSQHYCLRLDPTGVSDEFRSTVPLASEEAPAHDLPCHAHACKNGEAVHSRPVLAAPMSGNKFCKDQGDNEGAKSRNNM